LLYTALLQEPYQFSNLEFTYLWNKIQIRNLAINLFNPGMLESRLN